MAPPWSDQTETTTHNIFHLTIAAKQSHLPGPATPGFLQMLLHFLSGTIQDLYIFYTFQTLESFFNDVFFVAIHGLGIIAADGFFFDRPSFFNKVMQSRSVRVQSMTVWLYT